MKIKSLVLYAAMVAMLFLLGCGNNDNESSNNKAAQKSGAVKTPTTNDIDAKK